MPLSLALRLKLNVFVHSVKYELGLLFCFKANSRARERECLVKVKKKCTKISSECSPIAFNFVLGYSFSTLFNYYCFFIIAALVISQMKWQLNEHSTQNKRNINDWKSISSECHFAIDDKSKIHGEKHKNQQQQHWLFFNGEIYRQTYLYGWI